MPQQRAIVQRAPEISDALFGELVGAAEMPRSGCFSRLIRGLQPHSTAWLRLRLIAVVKTLNR